MQSPVHFGTSTYFYASNDKKKVENRIDNAINTNYVFQYNRHYKKG